MSTGPSGLERAFREACAPQGIAGGEVDVRQLDMLRNEHGRLPGNVFQLIREGKAAGPGRPKGVGNKRNAKLAQLVCSQHGDPVLFMASIYSMPTDQLVELLRQADNAAEREERLYTLAETIEAEASRIALKGELSKAEVQRLERLVDRLADISRVLRSTPGDLAVKALALQKQAAQAVAEYTHSKQPVAVNLNKSADLTLIVPGINAPMMDPKHLEDEIRKRGLEAIDFENMQLIEAEAVEIEEGDE